MEVEVRQRTRATDRSSCKTSPGWCTGPYPGAGFPIEKVVEWSESVVTY